MGERFDPPAAHSMDTTWYAVDADGCVASFESGEAGGVPSSAAIGVSEMDNTFDVALLEGVLIARMFAAGTLPSPALETSGPAQLYVVLEPSSDETPSTYRDQAGHHYPAQALLAKFDPRVAWDRDPRVVVTRKPVPPAKIEEIARAKGVLRVLTNGDLWDLDRDSGGALFSYQNDDYEDAGHYARREAPADPIRVGDLPEEIRAAIATLTLDVRFADRAELQLRDHVAPAEVLTWGGTLADPQPGAAAPEAPPQKPRSALPFVAIGAGLLVLALLYYLVR